MLWYACFTIVPKIDQQHSPPDVGLRCQGRSLLLSDLYLGRTIPRTCLGVEWRNALRTLHGLGFVHCDLKPENLLIDEYHRLKLTDFGLSRPIPTNIEAYISAGKPFGTPGYMAPEVEVGKPFNWTIDYYALGKIVKLLWDGNDPCGDTEPWFTSSAHLDIPSAAAAQQFVQSCLARPDQRFQNFDQICQHPYYMFSCNIESRHLEKSALGFDDFSDPAVLEDYQISVDAAASNVSPDNTCLEIQASFSNAARPMLDTVTMRPRFSTSKIDARSRSPSSTVSV